MKNILLWGLATLAVLGGIIAMTKNLKSPDLSGELSKPWIEVIQPAVFELAGNQNDKLRELLTGDELSEGAVISVEKAGLANIHFPDGSVARLDGGTKLVMENGNFDPKSGALSVTLNLVWGRVWSKIVGLATPESHWEVKTSTAVATVRGTAFGVEYMEEGKSNIVGYENKVEVTMIDPDTKKILEGIKMIVEPEKFLEVKKEAIVEMKKHLARNDVKQAATAVISSASAVLMEVKQSPKAMMEKDWVKRGIEEDRKLEEKITRIKEKVKDELEVRKEIRKELREDFIEKINERREEIKEKQAETKERVKEKVIESREILKEKLNEGAPGKQTEIREQVKEKLIESRGALKEKFDEKKEQIKENIVENREILKEKIAEEKEQFPLKADPPPAEKVQAPIEADFNSIRN